MKHFNIFVLSLLIGFAASAVFTSCDNSEDTVDVQFDSVEAGCNFFRIISMDRFSCSFYVDWYCTS